MQYCTRKRRRSRDDYLRQFGVSERGVARELETPNLFVARIAVYFLG